MRAQFSFVFVLLLAGFVPGVFGETFRPEKLAAMDAAIQDVIANKKCPGGVLWIEHNGISYHKAYGERALVPDHEPMTEDTIFDAASLKKVVATTPAITTSASPKSACASPGGCVSGTNIS